MERIKDIASIQTGLFARPYGTGEVAYIQLKHWDNNGRLLGEIYPELMASGISKKHLLGKDDVLFAAKGTKNFAAVYENLNHAAVASTSFFVIRPTNTKILSEYLAWFLNHPETQRLLKDKARGTAMPSIRKSVLDELEISIPTIEKQKLIIELSKLAKKETELRNQITYLKKQIIDQKILNEINNST